MSQQDVLGLLDGWSGVRVLREKDYQNTRHDLTSSDLAVVHPGGSVDNEARGVGYTFELRTHVISVDLYTTGDLDHLSQLEEEAQRRVRSASRWERYEAPEIQPGSLEEGRGIERSTIVFRLTERVSING